MKFYAIGLLSLLLGVSGCSNSNGPSPLARAAVVSAVSGGVLIGVNKYPEAEPGIRAAEAVICAQANSTNVQPDQIVAALEAANITNAYSRIIVNGVIAIYDGVFESYGKNWLTNQVALQGYLGAVCDGMTAALPPPPRPGARAVAKRIPPHLK